MSDWYYADRNRNRHGPITGAALAALHAQGQLAPDTLVWHDGMPDWQPWRSVMHELVANEASTPRLAQPDAPDPEFTTHASSSPYAPPRAPLSIARNVTRGNEVIYAGFWKRVAAYTIDSSVLGLISGVIGMMIGAVLGVALSVSNGSTASVAYVVVQIVVQLVTFALCASYYGWMQSSGHQATLGKMAIGIKVTRTDGSPISFWRGFGRYFAMIPSSLILGIGFFMAGFTERKQALHDLICDTLVVDRWAFTDRPDLQRRELGTVTIVVLVLMGLLVVVSIGFIVLMFGVLARSH